MVGEQSFDVMLGNGQNHTEDSGNQTESQDCLSPPQRRHFKEGGDPQQTIDAHFDNDARHEGRHITWGAGMGTGQPDMEGDKAGLAAKTEEGQQKNSAGQPAIAGKTGGGRQKISRRHLQQQGKTATEG